MQGKLLLAVAAATVLTLGGCSSDDTKERQEETLHALNAEMGDEERVAICDGYDYDPGIIYYAFKVKWESILVLEPPEPEVFNAWMEQTVCNKLEA